MKVAEVKQKYKDEWVLAEVLEEDELNRPTEVDVILHSKNRDDTYREMKNKKHKYTYHFYTGELPKGYAVAFDVHFSV